MTGLSERAHARARPNVVPTETEPKWSISLFRVLSFVTWCVPLLLCVDLVTFILLPFFIYLFRLYFVYIFCDCPMYDYLVVFRCSSRPENKMNWAKGSDIRWMWIIFQYHRNIKQSGKNSAGYLLRSFVFERSRTPKSLQLAWINNQFLATIVRSRHVYTPDLALLDNRTLPYRTLRKTFAHIKIRGA